MAKARSSAGNSVVRRSIADQIYHTLMEQILGGDLKAGDRLKEMTVARQFDASQAPVREALCRLVESGLVESECYRGARVRELRPRELREAYEVRAVLEGYAATLAARSLKENTKPLLKLAERTRKAAARKNTAAYVAADVPFHRMIVEAAENTVLLRLWDSLHFEVRSLEFRCPDRSDMGAFAEDHFAIVDALHRGDGRTASRLLKTHSLSVAALAAES